MDAINRKLKQLKEDFLFEEHVSRHAVNTYGNELAESVIQKRDEIREQIRILESVLNEGHDLVGEIQHLKDGIRAMNNKISQLNLTKLLIEKELEKLENVLKIVPELKNNDHRSGNRGSE